MQYVMLFQLRIQGCTYKYVTVEYSLTSLHCWHSDCCMYPLTLQILLRNRATNLNARMHDGTTPLILAARLAIEGMVEDLINADADINAADNSTKTALHWAAAVNNVDAVNILLSHGANRDAQDDKVIQACHHLRGLFMIHNFLWTLLKLTV